MINYNLQKEKWINFGIENKYLFILIVKDLEDADIFPVYFSLESEADKYSKNIISEYKLKIIEKINLIFKS